MRARVNPGSRRGTGRLRLHGLPMDNCRTFGHIQLFLVQKEALTSPEQNQTLIQAGQAGQTCPMVIVALFSVYWCLRQFDY